jgi:hypothetical protein
VARVLSYDRGFTGKVTEKNLPERMRGLIARGDINGDGALDKDEIRKLVIQSSRPTRDYSMNSPPAPARNQP